MAVRSFFTISNFPLFKEDNCEFKFYTGFALSQKQMTIKAFHCEILKKYPEAKILEVSRSSKDQIGVSLSAFNLKFKDKNGVFPVENIFQSSKVFKFGGPYKDLLQVHPREAKRDERLKKSGPLVAFRLNGEDWRLEPKTLFYDWIYINALNQDEELKKQIIKYDTFTDIEFNPSKSFNCQARSVAIFVSLCKKGLLNKYLQNKEKFEKIYKTKESLLF